ncbi:hypothetical protein DPMN_039275 [Dreissena polymorpha]|uniref:Uncharacterized protein n=1 Tax=Dreissena polymorpha TaxID=45954 RepID=A0A9D4MH12_DREPO|nr:hypothetical protein DPMN_039275 [Dreissena polymorpha]
MKRSLSCIGQSEACTSTDMFTACHPLVVHTQRSASTQKHADVGGSAPYRLGTALLEAEEAEKKKMAVSPTDGVSPSRPFALPNEFRLITRSYSHLVLISSLKDEAGLTSPDQHILHVKTNN